MVFTPSKRSEEATYRLSLPDHRRQTASADIFAHRYQRQQAITLMHEVNKIFNVPDPPLWSDVAIKSIPKFIARLKGAIIPSNKKVIQVSLRVKSIE